MTCTNHYPIMGNWEVIEETWNYTTWRCPKCSETYSSRVNHDHDTKVQSIKDGRKQYRSSLRQPWRDGEIDKVYLDTYPQQKEAMIKEGVITRDQANKAKDVWGKDDL